MVMTVLGRRGLAGVTTSSEPPNFAQYSGLIVGCIVNGSPSAIEPLDDCSARPIGPTGRTRRFSTSDRLRRQVSKESGDAPKLAVFAKLPDIEPGQRHCAIGTYQLPTEAELVVVGVDGARPAEPVSGKLSLQRGSHVADPSM